MCKPPEMSLMLSVPQHLMNYNPKEDDYLSDQNSDGGINVQYVELLSTYCRFFCKAILSDDESVRPETRRKF